MPESCRENRALRVPGILAWLMAGLAVSLAGTASEAAPPFADVGAQPTLLAPGVVSTGDDESHPTLSADGTRLYFLKNTPDFTFWTIAVTRWNGDGWSRPETVPFSGRYADADLAFAPDGSSAWFVSRRPVAGVPRTDTEIWRIPLGADGWGEPEHVAVLSSPADEWLPTVTADGTVYFGSARAGGLGGHDIWRARRVGDHYQPPENLGAPVNSPGEEIEAYVDPQGRTLVLAARGRGDGLGAYDLYLSRRTGDGGFSAPENLGPGVNSPAWDFGPRFSADGRLLLFTSNRRTWTPPLAAAQTYDQLERRLHQPGNGLRDIYVMRAAALGRSHDRRQSDGS